MTGGQQAMAGKDTHHEVFVKKHKKASWTLVEAIVDRNDAMALGLLWTLHKVCL